jgi:glycerol kinase
LADLWNADTTFRPTQDRQAAEASYDRWLAAVERSLEWEQAD